MDVRQAIPLLPHSGVPVSQGNAQAAVLSGCSPGMAQPLLSPRVSLSPLNQGLLARARRSPAPRHPHVQGKMVPGFLVYDFSWKTDWEILKAP